MKHMTILNWDKPKKILSKEEWEETTFDSGPKGGYQPNMSDEDAAKWKAKLVGGTTDHPQVEIRKSFGSQLTIIVNLGTGYNYKSYTIKDRWSTRGVNVHMATNGPLQLTFEQFREINEAVEEARAYLISRYPDIARQYGENRAEQASGGVEDAVERRTAARMRGAPRATCGWLLRPMLRDRINERLNQMVAENHPFLQSLVDSLNASRAAMEPEGRGLVRLSDMNREERRRFMFDGMSEEEKDKFRRKF